MKALILRVRMAGQFTFHLTVFVFKPKNLAIHDQERIAVST